MGLNISFSHAYLGVTINPVTIVKFQFVAEETWGQFSACSLRQRVFPAADLRPSLNLKQLGHASLQAIWPSLARALLAQQH